MDAGKGWCLAVARKGFARNARAFDRKNVEKRGRKRVEGSGLRRRGSWFSRSIRDMEILGRRNDREKWRERERKG